MEQTLTVDAVLGQEFLTWLWFRSEAHPDTFSSQGNAFTVTVEKRVVVQGGEGEAKETATVSGSFSQLREARMGLRTGKKVTRALLCFEQDELTWQTVVSADSFMFSSFKTPKVEKMGDDDDPDAFFLEKMYLIERGITMFESAYADFLNIRFSDKWIPEIKEMARWISGRD